MATTTIWGSEVQSGTTRAAKMSINITQTDTATQSKVTIAVYLHTAYAVLDNGNDYYFDMNATSATTNRGSVSIDHPSNSKYNSSNVTKLGESTFTYTKGTSAKTISCAAKIANVNYIKATPTVTASFTVPALASYTVSYNVNGSSGTAPSSQTKYYGKTLTLQPATANPSRNGYTFKNWNTKSDGSGTSYSPGANYTANANVTLYAQWTVITYKVSYNVNASDGSGAPTAQTKTHGVNLKLSTKKPSRPNYNFLKWYTKADGTGTSYDPGETYSTDANVTLYAQWEIAYVKPRITDFKVERCDQGGNPMEDGTCVHITASWECDNSVVEVLTSWSSQNGGSGDYNVGGEGRTGSVDIVIGDDLISTEYSYNVSLYVRDGSDDAHSSTKVATISSYKFHIDCKPGSNPGVAIGKAAELSGVFDVGLTSRFLGNRYCMCSSGTYGEAGYVLAARIEITYAAATSPITFVLTRRSGQTPMTVYARLSNADLEASTLTSFTYEGTNYGAFMVHTDTLVWDLYVTKGNGNDYITVQDWYTSKLVGGRIKVTFPGTSETSVPQGLDGFYRATPAILNNILDWIMPVGFVLTLYSHADPNDMYPGTKWSRIQNAFLWGCDSSGTIGQTGGEKTHTLTVNELPKHSHGSVYSGNATGTKNYAWLASGGSAMAYGAVETGGGAAHNNMPPYVQVSIWRRTA